MVRTRLSSVPKWPGAHARRRAKQGARRRPGRPSSLWFHPKIITGFILLAVVGFLVCFEAYFFYNVADRLDQHRGGDPRKSKILTERENYAALDESRGDAPRKSKILSKQERDAAYAAYKEDAPARAKAEKVKAIAKKENLLGVAIVPKSPKERRTRDQILDSHHTGVKEAQQNETIARPAHRALVMIDGIPVNSYPYSDVTSAEPCTLTIVVTDPRLPTKKPSRVLWAALESAIMHSPKGACVLVQTSTCKSAGRDDHAAAEGEARARAAFREIVDQTPRPLVKEFFQRSGRVRAAVLDHNRYHLGSCSEHHSVAWMKMRMNVDYWRTEFIQSMDSDMLLLHSDAVLCSHLDIEPWREFAYVSAPLEDDAICRKMEGMWKTWTNQTLRMCTNRHGLQAGGLSLRSRKWMIKAIEECPTRHSGIPSDTARLSPCNPKKSGSGHPLYEDQYFGTVLNGMKAPLPLSFEAALFASGTIFPEMAAKALGWSLPHQRQVVEKRLGAVGAERYNAFLKDTDAVHFLPIGIYKVDGYHNQGSYSDPGLHEQCPYLEYIIPLNRTHEKHKD